MYNEIKNIEKELIFNLFDLSNSFEKLENNYNSLIYQIDCLFCILIVIIVIIIIHLFK